ncbi:hypothetical protein [Deinococcus cellulosilyticus]|uniref:Uncharacterized protein n=1 Tax=Deinococcus cellulosilyticus (strain DSM 18568 / NBRC 106333 / KACC 11606 / 5516J-15) TaxID=1223518 RepID=A0A511N783_DEIC1|nr:hypothetical protein [Deinococcus cellulosilyticus]GEM48347.1 hypothetical protein DC3_39820 [Deinococcus cellulosilyticus NBRC 106333 = KACC 11606]
MAWTINEDANLHLQTTPCQARSVLNVDHLPEQDVQPQRSTVLLSQHGTEQPIIQEHLMRGGCAVVFDRMNRNDPEPRTEHWLMVHQGESAIPVVSLLELCIQCGETTLDHLEHLLGETALLLLSGCDPWKIRPHLLPENPNPKGEEDAPVLHS